MKKMDWLLPLLAIIFVLSGTALGGFLTYSFRKQSTSNQKEIKRINQEIEKVVKKTQKISDELVSITSTSKQSTEDIKKITTEINSTQKTLKEISVKTKELTSQNIQLSKKAGEVVELFKNIQTGGDSYLTIEIRYDPKKDTNNFLVFAEIEKMDSSEKGIYPLYNVDIMIESEGKLVKTFKPRDFNSNTHYQIAKIPIPKDKNYRYYLVDVFALNRNYSQYFMMKRSKEDSWYWHRISFRDQSRSILRDNKFQYKYPEDLKSQPPQETMYTDKILKHTDERFEKMREEFEKRKRPFLKE